MKQIAVRIETLVRKAYSLNIHDYKNTKMTEILMMSLTPQLRKLAIEKRASHPSSFREPDLDFRKLVDKLEQAEITMKLEETENLKLQYVNRIQTKTTHINNSSICWMNSARFPNVLRYQVSDGKFQMVSFFPRPNFPCIDFPMYKKFIVDN